MNLGNAYGNVQSRYVPGLQIFGLPITALVVQKHTDSRIFTLKDGIAGLKDLEMAIGGANSTLVNEYITTAVSDRGVNNAKLIKKRSFTMSDCNGEPE